MSDLIYTHISARVPDAPDRFLINAHGLLLDEITASSLLTVDLDGQVLTRRTSVPRTRITGCIRPVSSSTAPSTGRGRTPWRRCTPTASPAWRSRPWSAVAAADPTAMRFFTRLAYRDFNGPERDPGERDRLARDLGPHDAMVLRNHGLLTVGPSVGEARQPHVQDWSGRCQAQLAAMACNAGLNTLPPAVVERAVAMYAPQRHAPLRREGMGRAAAPAGPHRSGVAAVVGLRR